MKKLGVILLASVFVFGLAVQTNAMVSKVDESAFSGDEVITFNGIVRGEQIIKQISGVEFPEETVYGEDWFSGRFFGENPGASNVNLNDFNNQVIGASPYSPVITLSFVDPLIRVTRVGFDAGTIYGNDITVKVFRDGSEIDTIVHDSDWDWSTYKPLETFVGIEDPDGIDAIEITGDGSFAGLLSPLVMDNLRFGGVPNSGPEEIEVTMKIKPPNCLGASINIKSKGVTPVVIAGNEDFDVTTIDASSVRLLGVAPVRSAIEDVPHCKSVEPDGFLDLTLKFHTQDLVQAMKGSLVEGQSLENDSWVNMQLTGNLFEVWGGNPILGEDLVTLKGKQEKHNNGKGRK
jgi:hypothetical protein